MDKPEVVVRVVSHAYDADQVEHDLLRISKHGAVELEDESGLFWFTEDMVRGLARDWSMLQGKRRKNTRSRFTTNIVMSMPAGTDPEAVRTAALAFAKRGFGHNYQYVVALHTDAANPHAQLTVRNLGRDGHRLHVKKGDPQKWREAFAAELAGCGVEAQATLRAERGRGDGKSG